MNQVDPKTMSDLELANHLTNETDLAQMHSNNVMLLRQELTRRNEEAQKKEEVKEDK